jgi:hypothetical protein|mmetsp:Transcript_80808/g.135097  ORF Transcript_80808/g.135097 Transcript_80808/m.135097 type:complete len:80 (+) Transcript_80808:400-639(+)
MQSSATVLCPALPTSRPDLYMPPQAQTHTRTQCGLANTRQTPCGWHNEALGVDMKTPWQAMKNTVMWLGAFLQGAATEL